MNCRTLPAILAASIATLLSAHAADGPAPVASTKLIKGAAAPTTLKADLAGAKELHLVVTDAGDSFVADWADWAEPTLIKTDGSRVKLTELEWTGASAGFGKASVGKNVKGDPLRIAGQPVAFGIGTHAPSLISYQLPEGVVGFETKVGLDNGGSDQGNGATVVFQVFTQKPGPAVLAASEKASNATTKPYGFEAAKSSLAGDAQVANGLQAQLFAAEPQIQNPTNIDIDPRGRVWAVEAVNYRSSFKQWGILRPEGDRVVILEDTNDDGTADSEKTFWQSPDLKAPLGICVLPQARGTKVIVSAAPNVWLLTDADGDDKAEKAEILFKVKGNYDHDHQIHAFSFGPDGKFYFNMGNESRELLWPDGKTVVDVAGNRVTADGKPYRQGMVFRCDIDLESGKASNVETLGHNFRNNYEVAVDSFGGLWQSDNDDDGNKGVRINYVMEGGNYGYTDEITGAGWNSARTNVEKEIPLKHWHLNDPGVVPNLLQTGSGSPTGILVNEGQSLGVQFQNQVIHCDAGPRVVRAYPVKKDGAGYNATMLPLLESKDAWYRPSDISVAPDGSLMIADWYDPGVGGHNMGDHDKGTIRGRLYRVSATGPATKSPDPKFDTPENCTAALASPNNATRYRAFTALTAMGAKAEPALWTMAKSENPRLRARAYGVLMQPDMAKGGPVEALHSALTDADPDVRVAAIRFGTALSRAKQADLQALRDDRELVRNLMRDPNPQVRRQLALSLRGMENAEKAWAALAMQHDGKDRWYLEALGIGATGNEDACFDAWLAAVGDGWHTPAGYDIIWRMRSAKNAGLLARILSDESTPESERPRFLRAFDFLPASPAKTQALVQLASLGSTNGMVAGEAIQRLKGVDVAANPEVKKAVDGMLASAKGTGQFVALVRDFRLKDQGEGLLEVAVKSPASPEGIEAAKMLLAPDYSPAVERAIKSADALKLVEAFGNTADAKAVPHLSQVLLDQTRDAGIRRAAVKALAQSQSGVQALLKMARENQFPADQKLAAAGALAIVQMPQFKADIAQLFPLPSAAGGQALPPISQLVAMPSDAAHGRTVFEKAESTCTTCHRVAQVGADFGPALSEIGSKLGKEALVESIIAPNAGVSMGFETTQLTLKSGDAALGIVRSETADEVVLAMPGGIQNRYVKADIAQRVKLPNSMMPEGLQMMMTPQDLADLVTYLASLKAPQK